MRELRFRAWDKKHKQWFDDFHIRASGQWAVYDSEDGGKSGLWEHDISDDYDLEIMQFTGLKDKNGREIYEGDIIRTGDAISFVWFGYGKFNEAYYTENYKFDEPMLIDRDLSDFCDYTEVIGNIYENSDLLNVPSEKGE